MLRFNKFQKSYNNHLVLNIDDLQMEAGVYWLKGNNGIGKSTLLKSIAGFLAFEGSISYHAVNLKKEGATYRKMVNFAAAEPVFPEFLTGLEMIDLFKDAKGEIVGQADQLISEMNMQNYINHPLGNYSSGMLKKLSLILAFLGRPKLILLDEPLNAIDEESLKVLYNLITKKHNEEGVSFVLSSHQQIGTSLLPLAKGVLIENKTLIIKP